MGMNPTPLTVFYNSDYTASAYAFDTTRKSGVVAAGTVAEALVEVNVGDEASKAGVPVPQVRDFDELNAFLRQQIGRAHV